MSRFQSAAVSWKSWNQRGSYADLGAVGGHDRIRPCPRALRRRSGPPRSSCRARRWCGSRARRSGTLGLGPGAEHDRELRAPQRIGLVAGIGREVAVDLEVEVVVAQPGRASQPAVPLLLVARNRPTYPVWRTSSLRIVSNRSRCSVRYSATGSMSSWRTSAPASSAPCEGAERQRRVVVEAAAVDAPVVVLLELVAVAPGRARR